MNILLSLSWTTQCLLEEKKPNKQKRRTKKPKPKTNQQPSPSLPPPPKKKPTMINMDLFIRINGFVY